MINDVQNKKFNWEVILYYFAAVALPNIFLFNIYNQNRDTAQIFFNQVLILAVILALVSAAAFLILRLITRSYEGSLAVLLSAWLFFWFFEASLASLPISSRPVFLAIIFVVLLCFIILLRIISDRLRKIGIGFMAIAGIVTLLFTFNAIPTFITALSNSSVQVEREFDGVPIRRYFNVDPTLANPDIYWFHLDALMSFNTVDYYFDMPQDEVKNFLLASDFVINEDAEFIAHNTYFGVPGLLSPDFYDDYLHSLFMEGRYLLSGGRHNLLLNAIEHDGISLANNIAPYHELFHAFLQAGYRTVKISDFDPDVFIPIDQFYRLFDPTIYADNVIVNQENIFTVGDGAVNRHFLVSARNLIELLSLMTPVPARFVTQVVEGDLEWATIPTHTERIDELTANTLNLNLERQLYRNLLESLERPLSQPTLTYIAVMLGHPSHWPWIDEAEGDPTNFNFYPVAHEYAMMVTLNMIDLILERNPNAIIVLQSDHGMHFRRSQRALLAAGFTEEQVINLHNSVFSAVRIPAIYGGLDVPLDPRNITRELVNRFVGQNYELRTD